MNDYELLKTYTTDELIQEIVRLNQVIEDAIVSCDTISNILNQKK